MQFPNLANVVISKAHVSPKSKAMADAGYPPGVALRKFYSEGEKDFLTELVYKYIDIIESKRNDSWSVNRKSETWDKICDEFNAVTGGSYRPVKSLRKLWENTKARARREAALLKDGCGEGETRVNLLPPRPSDRASGLARYSLLNLANSAQSINDVIPPFMTPPDLHSVDQTICMTSQSSDDDIMTGVKQESLSLAESGQNLETKVIVPIDITDDSNDAASTIQPDITPAAAQNGSQQTMNGEVLTPDGLAEDQDDGFLPVISWPNALTTSFLPADGTVIAPYTVPQPPTTPSVLACLAKPRTHTKPPNKRKYDEMSAPAEEETQKHEKELRLQLVRDKLKHEQAEHQLRMDILRLQKQFWQQQVNSSRDSHRSNGPPSPQTNVNHRSGASSDGHSTRYDKTVPNKAALLSTNSAANPLTIAPVSDLSESFEGTSFLTLNGCLSQVTSPDDESVTSPEPVDMKSPKTPDLTSPKPMFVTSQNGVVPGLPVSHAALPAV